jgi:hypothetical protein
LISRVRFSRPNSASTISFAPKVLVSTASQPTAKKERWMSATTSGRVRFTASLQFSRSR